MQELVFFGNKRRKKPSKMSKGCKAKSFHGLFCLKRRNIRLFYVHEIWKASNETSPCWIKTSFLWCRRINNAVLFFQTNGCAVFSERTFFDLINVIRWGTELFAKINEPFGIYTNQVWCLKVLWHSKLQLYFVVAFLEF